jgi:predicted DNA-binding WGR domain protein
MPSIIKAMEAYTRRDRGRASVWILARDETSGEYELLIYEDCMLQFIDEKLFPLRYNDPVPPDVERDFAVHTDTFGLEKAGRKFMKRQLDVWKKRNPAHSQYYDGFLSLGYEAGHQPVHTRKKSGLFAGDDHSFAARRRRKRQRAEAAERAAREPQAGKLATSEIREELSSQLPRHPLVPKLIDGERMFVSPSKSGGKFWGVRVGLSGALGGYVVVTRWAALGANPREKVGNRYATEKSARSQMNHLVDTKMKKGYEEVRDG